MKIKFKVANRSAIGSLKKIFLKLKLESDVFNDDFFFTRGIGISYIVICKLLNKYKIQLNFGKER